MQRVLYIVSKCSLSDQFAKLIRRRKLSLILSSKFEYNQSYFRKLELSKTKGLEI